MKWQRYTRNFYTLGRTRSTSIASFASRIMKARLNTGTMNSMSYTMGTSIQRPKSLRDQGFVRSQEMRSLHLPESGMVLSYKEKGWFQITMRIIMVRLRTVFSMVKEYVL